MFWKRLLIKKVNVASWLQSYFSVLTDAWRRQWMSKACYLASHIGIWYNVQPIWLKRRFDIFACNARLMTKWIIVRKNGQPLWNTDDKRLKMVLNRALTDVWKLPNSHQNSICTCNAHRENQCRLQNVCQNFLQNACYVSFPLWDLVVFSLSIQRRLACKKKLASQH